MDLVTRWPAVENVVFYGLQHRFTAVIVVAQLTYFVGAFERKPMKTF